MRNFFFFILIEIIIFGCGEVEKKSLQPLKNTALKENKFVLDDSFVIGDVRRYGVFPDQRISNAQLEKIYILAQAGLPITFPKGLYQTNLILNDIKGANFIFEDVTISGSISILDGTSKVQFEGKLTILDKLFIRKSKNILFDSLTVKSDTINNLYKKGNRGVSIYVGSDKIQFNRLLIDRTGGSSDDFFKHTVAALQIHGWNDNPKNILIRELEIKNTERTGLYITGSGHTIQKATISNFGFGNTENIFALGDASPGEEKVFAGVWINRCNDCSIDSLIIENPVIRKGISLKLDEGKYHKPTFINNIHFDKGARNMEIKDNRLTNILVKNEF